MVSVIASAGRILLVGLCSTLVLFALSPTCALLLMALDPPSSPAQPAQRILAPELEGGVGWLGTDKPLLLRDLRGKIVVFDFWTLC
jgi:hypothetical protein